MALITAAQVISNSFTNKNTDTALIKATFIDIAENNHIRPALGDLLFDAIVAQNNAGTLTTVNDTLLTTYIIPALAFFVKYECLPDMLINSSSRGLMVNNSEFASAASSAQRAELADTAKRHGDILLEKMKRFIEHTDQTGDYPLYASAVSNTKVRGGIIL